MKDPITYNEKFEALTQLAHAMHVHADLHIEDMDDLNEAADYVRGKAEEMARLLQELQNAK